MIFKEKVYKRYLQIMLYVLFFVCFSPGPVNPDIVCFQQFPGMPGGPEGGMGMGPDMGQVMNGGE